MGYFSYIQFDHTVRAKVHWIVVSLVAAITSELPNNTSLHKSVPQVYHEFLTIFERKIVNKLPQYHSFHYAFNFKDS
jgi:hypothetical protein